MVVEGDYVWAANRGIDRRVIVGRGRWVRRLHGSEQDEGDVAAASGFSRIAPEKSYLFHM